jgi:hypothetical protein
VRRSLQLVGGTVVACAARPMALLFDDHVAAEQPRDPRATRILAKTIYRELRQSGLGEHEVISLAGELLSLVAADVKDRRSTNDK